MRGTEPRLSKLEQQLVPPPVLPCTCKDLVITHTADGREVVTLPPCGHHKRQEAAVVKVLKNVSLSDL